MSNTITSNFMSLPVPIPTVDPGPQYAVDLNSCLTLIDQHDHTSGKGSPITPAAISINTDFSLSGFNATNLRSARFSAQNSPISSGSDLGCLYVSGVDLYYNDINGNQIRFTQSGGIVASPGNITNLVAPASVTYVSATQTYVFQSSTSVAGNIDGGSFTLRSLVTASSGLTLSVPNNVSNYTLTLPSKLVESSSATQSVITFNSTGIASFGAANSAWQSYPISITAPTSPAKGTAIFDKAMWRRVGDSMEIRYDYFQNGGGTAGSGTYLFNIPSSGYLIDSNKTTIGAPGLIGVCGTAFAQGGTNNGPGYPVAFNSTALALLFYNSALISTTVEFVGSGTTPLSATTSIFSFQATVPIVGWIA